MCLYSVIAADLNMPDSGWLPFTTEKYFYRKVVSRFKETGRFYRTCLTTRSKKTRKTKLYRSAVQYGKVKIESEIMCLYKKSILLSQRILTRLTVADYTLQRKNTFTVRW